MTESLIAPLPTPQGATDDVAPPGSEERAASLIYRGPEAEAAPTAEAEAEDQSDAPAEDAAPVTYEPFVLPQGVEVDAVALEQAQSLFAEARLSHLAPAQLRRPADQEHDHADHRRLRHARDL